MFAYVLYYAMFCLGTSNSNLSKQGVLVGVNFFAIEIQSRPFKMRAPILYLANRWLNSKML